MQRRLNANLFDQELTQPIEERPQFSAVAHQKMNEEMEALRKKVSSLESQVEVLRGQLSQKSSQYEQKFDRLSRAMTQLEQQDRQANLALSRKVRALEEAMGERKVIDGKIENMVDRYNMSLQNFENRLTSLQKVISDKELTLMKYQAVIEQIYKEVEKLKNR